MSEACQVLFVDDEPNVLSGLRRMLRGMRSEWNMEFVDSAAAALEVLGERSVDVIVSDVRMPGTDGIVRGLCPYRGHPGQGWSR